jgi:ribosome-associated heat shock protein Hsp15
MTETVRIDKWLWATRFYKTRSLAAQAVSGGKVQLNGARIKPARSLKIDDRLEIHKDGYEYQVRVVELAQKRGPARLARTWYEESQESIRKREQQRAENRLLAASSPRPPGRPDKRARRHLRRLKE